MPPARPGEELVCLEIERVRLVAGLEDFGKIGVSAVALLIGLPKLATFYFQGGEPAVAINAGIDANGVPEVARNA